MGSEMCIRDRSWTGYNYASFLPSFGLSLTSCPFSFVIARRRLFVVRIVELGKLFLLRIVEPGRLSVVRIVEGIDVSGKVPARADVSEGVGLDWGGGGGERQKRLYLILLSAPE